MKMNELGDGERHEALLALGSELIYGVAKLNVQ